MSKLNTKDINTGGGTPKTIQPGNQSCMINKIELKDFRFKPGGYEMVLHMEGVDLGPEFDGFSTDKDNPTAPKHKGQVGQVKATRWAFADGETKTKVPVKRDQEILKFMKNLTTALGVSDWLTAQDNKHDTIEGLVEAFNQSGLYKGKFLKCCIAGKEYLNKQGYINYELFFPKFNKGGVPFEAESAKPSKVIQYNIAEHIEKKKVEDVGKFGGEGTDTQAKSEFEL